MEPLLIPIVLTLLFFIKEKLRIAQWCMLIFSFAWLCIYAAKYLTKELHISDLNHWWQCFGQCLTSVEPRAFIYERRISWKTGQNGRKTGEKWYVHSEKLILLCIRAAMKGPSHPGSPTPGGFRKRANGGQYAFKVVNISKVIYMC